jgi:hypothetical protein
MTAKEFNKLSDDLRKLAKIIPLRWGAIQNNNYDRLIDMFSCQSFEMLECAIKNFDEQIKQYFRRRWFMWQCAQCDEYLFCENDNVISNPNHKDQSWDVEINEQVKFDIKGTVIPYEMREKTEDLIRDPTAMIKFYYDRQSKGVRYCIQNRLFVVHHSFVEQKREFYLRCAWGVKRNAYNDFCKSLGEVKLYEYQNCIAGVIFVIEREKGKGEYVICKN